MKSLLFFFRKECSCSWFESTINWQIALFSQELLKYLMLCYILKKDVQLHIMGHVIIRFALNFKGFIRSIRSISFFLLKIILFSLSMSIFYLFRIRKRLLELCLSFFSGWFILRPDFWELILWYIAMFS